MLNKLTTGGKKIQVTTKDLFRKQAIVSIPEKLTDKIIKNISNYVVKDGIRRNGSER